MLYARDSDSQGGDDAYRKIKRIIEDLESDCDPFEIIGSNVYIQDWGLAVMPEFRGSEIGYNILACISRMAAAFRIPGAMIMSSKIETRILAHKLGFQTFKEIVYDDYRDDDGNVIFPVTDTKSLKFMGIKYQL